MTAGADATDAAFDDLAGRLDGGMVVVTTAAGDERAGCLVGFHTQCGMKPPRYAVWLSKANRTYRIGALADVFAVHFLRPRHRDLAALFGETTGDDVDKFERCEWTPGLAGVPLLADCPDRFVGWRTGLLDPGTDHVCFVLEPVEVSSGEEGSTWLTFQSTIDLDAAHPPEERQRPR
jgi:flavin reductase (DIM6/NTAB) family NADH-FMN oxidoreductase RutF